MNYLEILLHGYLNPNTRKYLEDYFIRECNAAKAKGYSQNEFFDGIMEAVNKLDAIITQQLINEKKELNRYLVAAIESGDQQSSEEIRKGLSRLNRSDYEVNLSQLPGRKYRGSLYDHDIQVIRNRLDVLIVQATPKQSGLTVKQVALFHIYEGIQITRQNGDEIAGAHGLASGEKLYGTYLKYTTATDRKGDPGTPRKLKEKIKLFESVISLLTSKSAKDRALSELEILKRYAR